MHKICKDGTFKVFLGCKKLCALRSYYKKEEKVSDMEKAAKANQDKQGSLSLCFKQPNEIFSRTCSWDLQSEPNTADPKIQKQWAFNCDFLLLRWSEVINRRKEPEYGRTFVIRNFVSHPMIRD